jgi:tRNA-dihydrouridine synthase A
MSTWDAEFYGETPRSLTREGIEEAMVAYMERAFKEDGCPWYAIARHMLGLYHGQRGARLWRQVWSNHKLKPLPPQEVMQIAREALRLGAEVPADTREVN